MIISTDSIVITHGQAFPLRALMHSSHRSSDNAMSKFRCVMVAPPTLHPVLHLITVEYSTPPPSEVTPARCEIPMMLITLVDRRPNFFNTEDVGPLYTLHLAVITIMDPMLSRRSTHFALLFTIRVARIHLAKPFPHIHTSIQGYFRRNFFVSAHPLHK